VKFLSGLTGQQKVIFEETEDIKYVTQKFKIFIDCYLIEGTLT